MRVGILVNVMQTEVKGQTTYRIASRCAELGHEVWIMSAGNFSYEPDDKIRARARTVPIGAYKSVDKFMAAFSGAEANTKWITVDDLDVLLLRNNPPAQSPWAQNAGINFGRLAMRHGVVVLNDPNGLAKAMNKLYFQTFPEEVRPRTLVTRNRSRLRRFAKQ